MIGTLTAAWLCRRVLDREDAPEAARAAAGVFMAQVLPRLHSHAASLRIPAEALVDSREIA